MHKALSGKPLTKTVNPMIGWQSLLPHAEAMTAPCVDVHFNRLAGRPLEDRLKIPVFLDNDINCLATYEKLSSHDDNASILSDDWLLEPMRQAFKQHLFSQIGKDLRFIVERRDFESWARGAGSLVLRHFLASPARVHTERMLVES